MAIAAAAAAAIARAARTGPSTTSLAAHRSKPTRPLRVNEFFLDMDNLLFGKQHRLADMITACPGLLLTFQRLNIPLGFGDKTVAEVCAKHGVDPDFFLLICNVQAHDDYVRWIARLSRIGPTSRPATATTRASDCPTLPTTSTASPSNCPPQGCARPLKPSSRPISSR